MGASCAVSHHMYVGCLIGTLFSEFRVRTPRMTDRKAGGTLRILLMGSIVGPVLLTIVVPILGLLQPGYDHVAQHISQLGVAGEPNAIVMRAVTSILGVSIIMFAFGLHLGVNRKKDWGVGSIGPLLVLVAGICMVAGGIFPCDPGCVPVSFSGTVHETVSNVGFPAMIIAPFATAVQLRNRKTWRRYSHCSIAAGIVATVLVPVYVLEVFVNWNGAIQRIILAVLLLWMVAMAIKLLRSSPHRDEPGQDEAPSTAKPQNHPSS